MWGRLAVCARLSTAQRPIHNRPQLAKLPHKNRYEIAGTAY